MQDARGFLSNIIARFRTGGVNSIDPPVRLSLSSLEDSPDQLAKARRRMGVARELLRDPVFQDAIQFMNEQVVGEIAACDPLDTDRLRVLRLHLGVISDFPQALAGFVDEYEQMLVIRREHESKQAEGAA